MKYRLQHFSGAYHWILDRGAPHYSLDGRFLGFYGGCAETESLSPEILSSQLRTSIAGVSAFARDLATVQLDAAGGHGGSRTPLKDFVRNLHRAEGERAQEMKHAASELEKLAADMITYARIPNDTCLMR
jgi:signal transduction histidine kinase